MWIAPLVSPAALLTSVAGPGPVAAALDAGVAVPVQATPRQQKGMPGLVREGVPFQELGPDSIAYAYVSGYRRALADGARVRLDQAQPVVAPDDMHSLAELAVQSADEQQIVEVGWRVAPSFNGDALPRLFVYHWVDGQATCYDGCGFVQVSKRVRPGMPVEIGKAAQYAIRHGREGWWVSYRGHRIGYFPDALWNGRFVRAGLFQAFGEVATAPGIPCTDMGNGILGTTRGSARIDGFRLLGSRQRSLLTLFQTESLYYDGRQQRRTAFRFGGPGGC
jgi:Neprosin